MRRGGGHPADRGEFLGDEIRYLVHAAARYDATQVLGARYQVNGADLGELGNSRGHVIKADPAFGGHRDVDQGGDYLDVGDRAQPVLVDDGLVAADDARLLPGRDLIAHLPDIEPGHGRDTFRRYVRV